MKQVSVIVPIFNSDKYLRRCLKSLSQQTGVDCEFICIDDGSTDDSANICHYYSEQDPRFKLISCEHRGVSAARNTGLDNACGEYICFLDSDDRFLKGSLKRLYDLAKKNDCDAVKFNAKIVHGEKWMKNAFIKHDCLMEQFEPNDIFIHKDTRPFVWAHFVKHELLANVRFNESLILGEDQEFIIRYLLKCKRVLFVSSVNYVHYNVKESSFNNVSNNNELLFENHIKIIYSIFPLIKIMTREFAEWIFDTAYYSYVKNNSEEKLNIINTLFDQTNVVDYIIDEKRITIIKKFFD